MSVLSSMRKVSDVEFLKQLQLLSSEVSDWAASQSPKNRELGATKLYNLTAEAFDEAFNANCCFPSDKKIVDYRIQHFKLARAKLHSFNAALTLLRMNGLKSKNKNKLKISNKKTKRWCNYSERADKLLKGVIDRDKKTRERLLEESKE